MRRNHIRAVPDVYVAVSKFKIRIRWFTSADDAAGDIPPPTCVFSAATS
jgi:hypothetical protein